MAYIGINSKNELKIRANEDSNEKIKESKTLQILNYSSLTLMLLFNKRKIAL